MITITDAPIGVFDSGMGGLTVLRELIRHLPNERFIYVGDTARVPYGSRSPETIRRYSLEIGQYLLKQKVKFVVIACNTSTAHAGELLQQSLTVPVLGVIQPGVDSLIKTETYRPLNKKTNQTVVGVIGTRSTIKSGTYKNLIQQKQKDWQVISKPCPLFVPLIEEGWTNNNVTDSVIRQYLQELVDSGVSSVILGCTHYPLIKPALKRVYPDLEFVDSSIEVALNVQAELRRLGTHNQETKSTIDENPTARILLTDITDHDTFLKDLFLGIDIGIEELPIDQLKS